MILFPTRNIKRFFPETNYFVRAALRPVFLFLFSSRRLFLFFPFLLLLLSRPEIYVCIFSLSFLPFPRFSPPPPLLFPPSPVFPPHGKPEKGRKEGMGEFCKLFPFCNILDVLGRCCCFPAPLKSWRAKTFLFDFFLFLSLPGNLTRREKRKEEKTRTKFQAGALRMRSKGKHGSGLFRTCTYMYVRCAPMPLL